jgi:RNA polymerase sigma-70 factor (ECF subfamily)
MDGEAGASMTRREFEGQVLEQLDAVYHMALQLTRNQEQAEELVQEVYVRALRPSVADRFRRHPRSADGLRSWLAAITHNTFYSLIRRERTSVVTEAEEHDNAAAGALPDDPPPAWDLASLDWEHVDARLKGAFDRLRPEFRQVLLLWGVHGLKYKQIAEILEVPMGTVMSRLYRARKLLADEICAPGGPGPDLGVHPQAAALLQAKGDHS